MKTEGFEGCIGFVDGTTIPLYQWPGIDGKVYWDRKKRYSINCQVICDCDKFITSFLTGWPGSCGDSLVYQQMTMHTKPTNHFDQGTYFIFFNFFSLTHDFLRLQVNISQQTRHMRCQCSVFPLTSRHLPKFPKTAISTTAWQNCVYETNTQLES